jgi:hypothetical protein
MKNYDLDVLLHPARAFRHPDDVVGDTDLTLNEKRAILASWASDACAIEAAPALRASPSGPPVQFDDVMDALRKLDQLSSPDDGNTRRKARPRALFRRSRGNGGGRDEQGSPLY